MWIRPVIRLMALSILVAACLPARASEPTDSGPASLRAEAEPGMAEKPAGHKEAGASGGAALNPIDAHGYNFMGDLAIWTAVVFVVVLAILWKFAWGPIVQGLDKRETQIAEQIAEAQRSNQDARQLLEKHAQKLAAAQDEVRAILDQARREAEKLGREMLDKAKQEAVAERDRAVHEIETATSVALKELADRSATLAVELAGKIVGATLSQRDHTRLIQETVANFAGKRNGTRG
jgi:F-type H+-transporting ATPase subunit b